MSKELKRAKDYKVGEVIYVSPVSLHSGYDSSEGFPPEEDECVSFARVIIIDNKSTLGYSIKVRFSSGATWWVNIWQIRQSPTSAKEYIQHKILNG